MCYTKSLLRIFAHVHKNFHISIKDLRLCANNPALEGFVIQNQYYEFLSMYAKKLPHL